jgi:hypothetical protein
VEMPPQYGAKMRDDIRASSIALRLRERSTYYFEVGFALARYDKRIESSWDADGALQCVRRQ